MIPSTVAFSARDGRVYYTRLCPPRAKKPAKAGGPRLFIISRVRFYIYLLAPTAVPGVHNRVLVGLSACVPLHAGPLAVQRRAYAARVF